MDYRGTLTKMWSEHNAKVTYYLNFSDDFICLNQALEKKIRLKHIGWECLSCGQEKEIFRQGFCKSCFFETPQAGDWVMRPELSTAHLNKEDRDLAYEKKVQLQPHFVYLANTGSLKVGVTRQDQIPTRWIDQGADQALPIIEVPNRYLAGVAEVALKEHVSDKTNWRAMLKGGAEKIDLTAERDKIAPHIPEETREYYLDHGSGITLDYPVTRHPESPKSLRLRKKPEYEGVLSGIKGQYLIFEDDTVFNVRSHEGYVVEIAVYPKNGYR